MDGHRKAGSRSSAGRKDAACAEALPLEREETGDKTSADSTPPRAGRTGNLGARAERPSEGRRHKGSHAPEEGRGAKAPSPAAKDGPDGSAALPQASRSTA